jgi:hypothetical protein
LWSNFTTQCISEEAPFFFYFADSNSSIQISLFYRTRVGQKLKNIVDKDNGESKVMERKYQAIAPNGATYPRLFRLAPIKACQTKKSTRRLIVIESKAFWDSLSEVFRNL